MTRATVRAYILGLGALALSACSAATDATEPGGGTPAAAVSGAGRDDPGTCMRTATGGLVCAGAFSSSSWQLVTVGGEHTCALKVNGAAFCWGSNGDGQLGVTATATMCGMTVQQPCSTTPREVQAQTRFLSISAGARHTCAITAAGQPMCWGANDRGQAGGRGFGVPTLVTLPSGPAWTQISAGFSHTCAVRADGAVFCWGANDRGQLGDGSTADPGMPVRAALPAPAASVSAGQERTCARTVANVVYCWGVVWTNRQDSWEMSRIQPTPELVPNAPAMGTLSVGTFTTCGSDNAGAAYCWEANPRGEMGVGTQVGSLAPQRVAAITGLSHVSAGMVQSCAVAADGTGYCWGDNTFGELGVSPSSLVERCDRQGVACSTVPVRVSGAEKYAQISTGLGSHTCGVTTGGYITCWGLGLSGQRGDGSTSYIVWYPAPIAD